MLARMVHSLAHAVCVSGCCVGPVMRCLCAAMMHLSLPELSLHVDLCAGTIATAPGSEGPGSCEKKYFQDCHILLVDDRALWQRIDCST